MSLLSKLLIFTTVILSVINLAQHEKIKSINEQLVQAHVDALNKTIKLQNKMNEIEDLFYEEQKKADRIISDLRRRYANGVQFKTESQSMPAGSGITDRNAVCGLSAEITSDLIDIAERGDRAIRSLNQCVNSYNNIRNQINNKK